MKAFLIGLMFLAIIVSLASALFFMMRGSAKGDGTDDSQRAHRMWLSLALRIGLSVLLFIGILLAWKLGWIRPSGIPLGS